MPNMYKKISMPLFPQISPQSEIVQATDGTEASSFQYDRDMPTYWTELLSYTMLEVMRQIIDHSGCLEIVSMQPEPLEGENPITTEIMNSLDGLVPAGSGVPDIIRSRWVDVFLYLMKWILDETMGDKIDIVQQVGLVLLDDVIDFGLSVLKEYIVWKWKQENPEAQPPEKYPEGQLDVLKAMLEELKIGNTQEIILQDLSGHIIMTKTGIVDLSQ
jgi:hypothetical protein